jgi:hypothetical protein
MGVAGWTKEDVLPRQSDRTTRSEYIIPRISPPLAPRNPQSHVCEMKDACGDGMGLEALHTVLEQPKPAPKASAGVSTGQRNESTRGVTLTKPSRSCQQIASNPTSATPVNS